MQISEFCVGCGGGVGDDHPNTCEACRFERLTGCSYETAVGEGSVTQRLEAAQAREQSRGPSRRARPIGQTTRPSQPSPGRAQSSARPDTLDLFSPPSR